ncbi:MAG: sensor histidine kinase [Hyphomicrobiales bacterium]|nr:MAG: sensor histidine kinase [Hyphomicrobiales bacterium]
MIANSLRVRLTILGLFSIVVILAIAAFGLSLLFERHVTRRVTAELDAYVRQLAADVSISSDGSLVLTQEPTDPRFAQPYGGIYWQIESEASKPLRSRSLWDFLIDLPRDELQPGALHQHLLNGPSGSTLIVSERSISVVSPRNTPIRIAAGVDAREITRAVHAFMGDATIALLGLAGVLGAVSWLQVAIGLRPLAALRSAVASVRAGTCRQLDLASPSEIMPLVNEVNSLLTDRAAAIETAQKRAADLAHGLKTPLTVLATDAERLRAKGETEIADELEDLAADMSRHIQYELSRARIGASASTGNRSVVRAAVERLVRTLGRTPNGMRLAWQVDVPEALTVFVRDDDLLELLGTILENAAKWAKATVKISASSGTVATVMIEDDGQGVPEAELSSLGGRGVRLDETSEGSGLGLSIAGEIAQKYTGKLQFQRSPLGGLKVVITLPASP